MEWIVAQVDRSVGFPAKSPRSSKKMRLEQQLGEGRGIVRAVGGNQAVDAKIVNRVRIGRKEYGGIRTIELAEATGSLSEYAREARKGTLVVTRRGKPVAAVVPVEGIDLESLSLSTDRDFIRLIERSRASCRATGGLSLEEVRRRYGFKPKTQRRKAR